MDSRFSIRRSKLPQVASINYFSKKYKVYPQTIIASYEKKQEIEYNKRGIVGRSISWFSSLKESCSGQDTYKIALLLHNTLNSKASKAQHDFDNFRREMTSEITKLITHINNYKKNLSRQGFPKFVAMTTQIAHWKIKEMNFFEIFSSNPNKLSQIVSRENLFKTDFDNKAFSTWLKQELSFGFWTRKEASQSLSDLKNKHIPAFEKELAELDAEKVKLKTLYESLLIISDILGSIIDFYYQILNELEYGIGSLKATQLLTDSNYFLNKIDCYFLPEYHLKCLMCAAKLTRILYHIFSQKLLYKTSIHIPKSHRIIQDYDKEIKPVIAAMAAT